MYMTSNTVLLLCTRYASEMLKKGFCTIVTPYKRKTGTCVSRRIGFFGVTEYKSISICWNTVTHGVSVQSMRLRVKYWITQCIILCINGLFQQWSFPSGPIRGLSLVILLLFCFPQPFHFLLKWTLFHILEAFTITCQLFQTTRIERHDDMTLGIDTLWGWRCIGCLLPFVYK